MRFFGWRPSAGFTATVIGRLGATALAALVGLALRMCSLVILLYLALTGLLRSGALEWLRPPMPKIANEGSPFADSLDFQSDLLSSALVGALPPS